MAGWQAAAAASPAGTPQRRQAASRVLATAPSLTIRGGLRHTQFERQAEADRLADGLRQAGLPL